MFHFIFPATNQFREKSLQYCDLFHVLPICKFKKCSGNNETIILAVLGMLVRHYCVNVAEHLERQLFLYSLTLIFYLLFLRLLTRYEHTHTHTDNPINHGGGGSWSLLALDGHRVPWTLSFCCHMKPIIKWAAGTETWRKVILFHGHFNLNSFQRWAGYRKSYL